MMSYFRTMLYIYIYFFFSLMRPTSYRCPTSHYTRQTCRTLISVCQSSGCYVIPAGWTFREGPGQINHSWCFQTEPGRPSCHGLKAVQPALWAITASRAPEFKNSRAILALGGFQPLIRPSVNPEFMSGRFRWTGLWDVFGCCCCCCCCWLLLLVFVVVVVVVVLFLVCFNFQPCRNHFQVP